MDLSTIEKKIINGCYYKNFEEMEADLQTFLASVKEQVEVTGNELESKIAFIVEQLRLRKLNLQQMDCVFKETRSKKGKSVKAKQ